MAMRQHREADERMLPVLFPQSDVVAEHSGWQVGFAPALDFGMDQREQVPTIE